jgi:Cu/Ag efflux pump CusA
VNLPAALRHDIKPGDVRRALATLTSGLTVGNFFEDQAVFDVIVQGTPSVRSSLDAARNLLIDTSGGGHVRLGEIAQVSIRSDPVAIQHQALSRYVDVSAPVASGELGAARAAIERQLRHVSFPLTYHAEILGGTPNDPTSHVAFLSYVLAAAVGVLLLLQAAFGSWRLAALLFLLLPVALLGGVLVALATGQLRSLAADAGLLAVFAFAARQGMLQVAHMRRLQALDGGPLTAGIAVRAARERLAPSLGAAVVAAVALLPFVVMGDVAGNEMTHTAAAVILGGLLSATLLSQLLLPALCLALGPTEPLAAAAPSKEIADAPSAHASSSTPS